MTNVSETVIYESVPGDFLSGTSQHRLKITNKISGNINRTIVQYFDEQNAVIAEKTSDNIVKLIGQENFNTLHNILSMFCLEFKVKGILTVLTENEIIKSETITTNEIISNTVSPNNEILTKDELEIKQGCEIINDTIRRRIRRRPKTYVVTKDHETQDKSLTLTLNEDIVDEEGCLIQQEIIKKLKTEPTEPVEKEITESRTKHSSEIPMKIQEKNVTSTDVTEPNLPEICPTMIKLPDGHKIMVSVKPDDYFHIATPEILKDVTHDERKKLVKYQLFIDWKFCLERNEDGYLPLHLAVQFNDLPLLRRQCLMLIRRQASLDITANEMTALQMSLAQEDTQATSILLQYGANPLYCDDEEKTILHSASELKTDHLKVILEYCQNNARKLLLDTIWQPSMETKSDSELVTCLLDYMSNAVDAEGYTPLMRASQYGISKNVSLLINASPSNINKVMPNSGRTALFLAVEAACFDAIHRGNKSVVGEEFAETLKILIENGADLRIRNFSGIDVTELVSEHNIPELVKLLTLLHTKTKTNSDLNLCDYMILNEDGQMKVCHIDQKPKKCDAKKSKRTAKQNVGKIDSELNATEQATNFYATEVKKAARANATKIKKSKITNPKVIKIIENVNTATGIIRDAINQPPIPNKKVVICKKPVVIKPKNKPIVVKKGAPMIYNFQSNVSEFKNIDKSSSFGPKITIHSNVKLANPMPIKRLSENIILTEVKKKKSDDSTT